MTILLRRELRERPEFRLAKNDRIDVLLNFPDKTINAYQVRQWYGPLEQLAKIHSVGILCFHPKSAQLIEQETSLKVVLAPGYTDLSEVEQMIRPKVILYPNQNYANYRLLGLVNSAHVFICHGESDKIYMASNWVKVFNYFFVAGQASRDRLRRHVRNYDVVSRTIEIGRPQIDIPQYAPVTKDNNRTTVLYAPTWEGGRRSMRYGSVASHGEQMVRALLSDHNFNVIYRPHPRTGVHSPEFAASDREIRRLIVQANVDDEPRHLVDESQFGWQLNFADVMISDVSAVAYDWLTTGKPLLLTEPVEPEAVMPHEGFIAELPMVTGSAASSIVGTICAVLSNKALLQKYSIWADYYYGDRSAGASLKRFEDAIDRVIRERDNAVERNRPTVHPSTTAGTARLGNTSALGRYARHGARMSKRALFRDKDTALAARTRIAIESGRLSPIVVTAMGEPDQLRPLTNRLEALETVNRARPVAIVVSNRDSYKFLRKRTDLTIIIGDSATTSEAIYTTISPYVSLHFDQANLNLREATHRAITHVYIGASDDLSWINNRLRLFDIVVYPEQISEQLIRTTLIDFPDTINFAPWGPATSAQSLSKAVLSICDEASTNPDHEK